MGRPAKPWFRAARGYWCVTIRGKLIVLGPDKEKAEREFHRIMSLTEELADTERVPVWRLVDRYLEWTSTRLRKVTHDQYVHTLQDWVKYYGRLRAMDLRPFHVSRWLERHPNWVSRSTRTIRIAVIKAWSSWCASEGYLEADRLRVVKTPGFKVRIPAPPGDLEKLIEAADEPAFRDFLTVLADTGCRPGEIRNLTAADIVWEASTATVQGKTGPRIIGITKRSLEILRRNAAEWPHGPVLRAPTGNPWSQPTVGRYFKVTSKRAGIAHFTPYLTRHDFWRRAVAGGVDSVTIAKQLGHSSLALVARNYAHPDPGMLANAAEAALPTSGPVLPPSVPQKRKVRGKTQAKLRHRPA